MIIIGIIEGVAEATALMLKVFSGVISDYVGKRKGAGAARLWSGSAE